MFGTRGVTGSISHDSQRVGVLIPTFNNAATLEKVIDGCREYVDSASILIVDDGSTDETPQLLVRFAADLRTLRHETNRGKGSALRSGFRYLETAGFTHAVTLDADGQHFPSDLPRFLGAIADHPESLLVGERNMQVARAPRRSLVGLALSNRVLGCLAGVRLRDSQSGFRAYPLATVSQLHLRGDRYEFEFEVLVQAGRRGVSLVSVPIDCAYDVVGGGVSHFRPLRDVVRIAWSTLRLLVRQQ